VYVWIGEKNKNYSAVQARRQTRQTYSLHVTWQPSRAQPNEDQKPRFNNPPKKEKNGWANGREKVELDPEAHSSSAKVVAMKKKEKKEEEETNREESVGSMTLFGTCRSVYVWSDGAKPEMGFFPFYLNKKKNKKSTNQTHCSQQQKRDDVERNEGRLCLCVYERKKEKRREGNTSPVHIES
jgi:hypothetical protein